MSGLSCTVPPWCAAGPPIAGRAGEVYRGRRLDAMEARAVFESRYDASRRLMIHTGNGRIGVKDFVSATQRWFADPRFEAAHPVVWDVREDVTKVFFTYNRDGNPD